MGDNVAPKAYCTVFRVLKGDSLSISTIFPGANSKLYCLNGLDRKKKRKIYILLVLFIADAIAKRVASSEMEVWGIGTVSSEMEVWGIGTVSSEMEVWGIGTVSSEMEVWGIGTVSSEMEVWGIGTVSSEMEVWGIGTVSSEMEAWEYWECFK